MTKSNGLPCTKCGTSEWRENSDCKQCARDRSRRRAKDNPDKQRENTRKWRRDNPQKRKQQDRRYRAKHTSQLNERKLKWAHENPGKRRDISSRYRQNNLDDIKERGRKWERDNPEKVAAKKHRRRTRKTQAGGSYTGEEFKALCEQYDNRCLCCGQEKPLEFDHVIPISKGGSSDISNGQPLCRSCNSSKGDKTTDYRTKPGILRWIQEKLFN